MTPWFIATERFGPEDGDKWRDYIAWSGLTQLKEVISLDGILCPTLLPVIKAEYWPHIVQEDFMLNYFLDFDFLMSEVASVPGKNVLCVFRNPIACPKPPPVADFEFLGYDLVDVYNGNSALSNCRGFPEVFSNSELSEYGLLPELERANEVRASLRARYPEEHHTNCHVWAIFRASGL
jgi:hypothetical protein